MEMLEYLEKTSQEKEVNQLQTQPTQSVEARNWTWATLVGGKCSHHYITLAPHDVHSKQKDILRSLEIPELTVRTLQIVMSDHRHPKLRLWVCYLN